MIYHFSNITVDDARYELRRDQSLISVEPLVFDLLVYFLQRPDQVISHDELIQSVWSGRIVSDSTISGTIKSARKVIGDDGRQQRFIQTIRRRGFKFSYGEPSRSTNEGDVHAHPIASSKTKEYAITLTVQPFQHMFDSSALSYYIDGLSAALETTLTRVPLLRVCYSNTELNPTGNAHKLDERARYIVSGAAQVIDHAVRINIKLNDTRTGYTLWGEIFEAPLNNDYHPNSELLFPILNKLEPQLTDAIYTAARDVSGETNAKTFYLEAVGIMQLKGWHSRNFEQCAQLLRRAIELDAEFSLAHGLLAQILATGINFGLLPNTTEMRSEAEHEAETALLLTQQDSIIQGFSGCALSGLGFISRGEVLLKNAISLNPSNAQAWAALGTTYLKQNKVFEAIEVLTKSIEISPLDKRLCLWGSALAMALCLTRQHEKAVSQALLACSWDEQNYFPRVGLAATYLASKDTERAREALQEAYRIRPELSPQELASIVGKNFSSALLACY